ncbi:MAG: hypothetical protein M3O28_04510, partial [Actinomycetota bacterium]|nr:hypothetical protein [Actinomycetota bacterium]
MSGNGPTEGVAVSARRPSPDDDGFDGYRYVPSVLDAEGAPDDVAAWAARMTPGSAVVTPLAGV